jgi:hypothetical protein
MLKQFMPFGNIEMILALARLYDTKIGENIINTIVYRGWRSPKLREHITHLLI